MNFSDILGLGKILPIDKLIDVVSQSVGRLSKPYFDRKDVDTKVYEIEKLAKARAEEMKIISTAIKENFKLTGGIEYKEEKLAISSPRELPIDLQPILSQPPVEERAQKRMQFQEAKKQINIENVTAFASEELKSEAPVTDEPLDEDWATRFFRIAEDISNEEMQALWGKILAGEVKQPKSYSLRTLELIRNLSKKEADIFMKVANFAIRAGNANYLFTGEDEKILDEKYNISYSETALLTEIGLIQPGAFVSYQLTQKPSDGQHVFIAGNIVIIVKIKANTPTIPMPVHVFSNSGNELLRLINSNPPIDYLASIANSIKSENVEVKYAYILSWQGDAVRHTQPLQDFPS